MYGRLTEDPLTGQVREYSEAEIAFRKARFGAPVLRAPYSKTFDDIRAELERAAKYAGFNSAHEGYAILLEEVNELWEHVKTNQKKRDIDAMRAEAVQVAAMAVKFVTMLDEGRGRK